MWQWAALISLLTVVAARRGVSLSSFSLKPPLLERLNYITTYACEGRELRVGCDNGGVIRLVRANYGRFSISICNDQGTLDWKVNCMSYRSFLIMQDRCSQQTNCSVVVSSSMFGDPCPGTLKYLEVQYHCVSGSGGAIGKLSPSLSAYSNGTNETAVDKIDDGTSVVSTVLYTPSSPLSSSLPPDIALLYTESLPAKSNISASTIESFPKALPSETPFSSNDPTPQFKEGFCSPIVSRDLFWNWTKRGDYVTQKCPGGSSGTAKWHCGYNPIRWKPDVPDLNECKSFWVENLRRRLMDGESVISVSTNLGVMAMNKPVFKEDLKDITDLIQKILSHTVDTLENSQDMWHRYHVLRELLQSLLETVSNLLEDDQVDAWEELTSSDRRHLTSTLLGELEESALLLAEASGQDDSFTIAKNNVLLSVQVLNSRTLRNVQFPVFDEFKDDNASTAWIRMEDSLILPAQALTDMSRHGLAKVVFMAYTRVGEFLKPEFDYHPRSLSQDTHTLSDDPATSRNVTRVVNSRVIAASIGKSGMIRLTQPVTIILKHLQEDNVTNPFCVYWDFHEREWSGQGCWVHHFNRTHTICACDHLTNFAVIMDIRPLMEQQNHRDMLSVIVTIGCATCIFCLLITIFLLFLLRNLKDDCIIVHRNLFICLLITEVIFVGGIDQTKYHVICGIIGGLLHYFLLATLAWVFVEGFQQYVTLTETFEQAQSRKCWYCLLAYGVPALIVTVSAISDPGSYGTERHCWLRADNYFIFSFIAPAVGILFGGVVFLCIAGCLMCRHSTISTTIKGKEEAKLASIKSWIRLAVVLLCIIVLTWTSGLLYANEDTVFLAYVFTVCNSLQGIYILVFYSFGSEKVREELRKLLHQRGLLPSRIYSPKSEEPLPSHQPNGAALPVSSPSQHSALPESWSSPKEENSSIVPKFTIPGLPYIVAPSTHEAEGEGSLSANNENRAEELMKPLCGLTTAPQTCSTSTIGFPCHTLRPSPISRSQEKFSPYQQCLGSNVYTTPSEHIYEAIDSYSDQPKVQLHHNSDFYHTQQSNLSQYSSHYGCQQQQHPFIALFPANIQCSTLPEHIYNTSNHYSRTSPKVQKRHHHGQYQLHRRSSSDKVHNEAIPRITYNTNSAEILRENTLNQKYYDMDNIPVLPDLLKCPNDSSVVMAILEGEKVVSCLQAESSDIKKPSYKLSTYC